MDSGSVTGLKISHSSIIGIGDLDCADCLKESQCSDNFGIRLPCSIEDIDTYPGKTGKLMPPFDLLLEKGSTHPGFTEGDYYVRKVEFVNFVEYHDDDSGVDCENNYYRQDIWYKLIKKWELSLENLNSKN